MSTDSALKSDERAMVAAAQAGDERAFRRLVEPYRRALEVHCYRMLGSPQDAEDVVQETLLRAWRSLDRFERRASVQTWLYRVATNACLDELERRPRRPEQVQPYPDARLEDLASPVADPAARYALHEGMELAFLDVTAHAVAPRATHERELLRRYVDVWDRADIDGFLELLREDAALRMPPRPAIVGAAAVGEFWFSRRGPSDCRAAYGRLVPTSANGRPAVAVYHRGEDGTLEPFGVMLLDVDDEKIAGFDAYLDPALVPLFDAG